MVTLKGSMLTERERDTPIFCPTLQVLDMSTLHDAADVNPAIKFLPHMLQHLAVDSSDCLHYPLSQQSCNKGSWRQMLQCVWQELDYRIYICRVTKGGHIKHL
jgi:hypothetical protein